MPHSLIFEHMFQMPLPILEKLLRPVIVYLVLVLLLRLFGKRELAQLNPFDLVVLLSLSNTVQNAIIGDDNSVSGGVIGAFSLLAINWLVVRVLFRSTRLTRMFEGKPSVLVLNGQIDKKALERESLTREELIEVIHRQGFEHIHQVRRCELGEQGVVISRYQGIAGYDWVAMPLIPYLYSVERISDVPERVDKETVRRLRDRYHEKHLGDLGKEVDEGNLVRGGWTQLVGAAYERRTYAFRFATSEAQDDAIIARLNGHDNRSDFNLIYNNCADFARTILNSYFPKTFKRNFIPDARNDDAETDHV